MMDRAELERLEDRRLAPFATRSASSAGRAVHEEPDEYRTAFQRDKDRVIHSKAFRRLSHKTQVFLSPEGDHYRTRLTHTLEVCQISRTIARALALNEDLTEAIALAHDLGHTPFGHTGEAALSECVADVLGVTEPAERARQYRHNEQSLRVVDVIEKGGAGLNLTAEVRDGILCHTGSMRASTPEGRVVAIADRIAYVNHDIDDAIRAGVIADSDLPASTVEVLGTHGSARIASLVKALVRGSDGTDDIRMTARAWDAMMHLRSYLFERVYESDVVKREVPKAIMLIKALFRHYLENPDEVPEEYVCVASGLPWVAARDYVSGMTDRYAVQSYEDIFIPFGWKGKCDG